MKKDGLPKTCACVFGTSLLKHDEFSWLREFTENRMCLNTFEKHLKSRLKKCQRLVTLNALLISNKPFIIAVAAFDKKPTDMTWWQRNSTHLPVYSDQPFITVQCCPEKTEGATSGFRHVECGCVVARRCVQPSNVYTYEDEKWFQ